VITLLIALGVLAAAGMLAVFAAYAIHVGQNEPAAIAIVIALALGPVALHDVFFGHERSWIVRPLFWVFERVVWALGGVRPE
jgi:hypothetical protein